MYDIILNDKNGWIYTGDGKWILHSSRRHILWIRVSEELIAIG